MIEYCEGSIFKSEAEMLVVPVNTKGVMGAGLALQFKEKWPDVDHQYKIYCEGGMLKPGKIMLIPSTEKRPIVVLFATKQDWQKPSKLEWIETGLEDLRRFALNYGRVSTIAMPQLGCGLGGLEWRDVKGLIERTFKEEPEIRIEVYIYAPKEKQYRKKLKRR